MDTKSLILVTYARQYDIDGSTKGCSVNYYFLNERGEFMRTDADGQQNAKVSMQFEDRDKFTEIPAVYEGTFSMTIGSDRKPTLRLTDVKFHAPVMIKQIDPKKTAELNKNAATEKP